PSGLADLDIPHERRLLDGCDASFRFACRRGRDGAVFEDAPVARSAAARSAVVALSVAWVLVVAAAACEDNCQRNGRRHPCSPHVRRIAWPRKTSPALAVEEAG